MAPLSPMSPVPPASPATPLTGPRFPPAPSSVPPPVLAAPAPQPAPCHLHIFARQWPQERLPEPHCLPGACDEHPAQERHAGQAQWEQGGAGSAAAGGWDARWNSCAPCGAYRPCGQCERCDTQPAQNWQRGQWDPRWDAHGWKEQGRAHGGGRGGEQERAEMAQYVRQAGGGGWQGGGW